MKATIKRETAISLCLGEAEAVWLRDLMQNPFVDEDNDDRFLRHELFETLKEALA